MGDADGGGTGWEGRLAGSSVTADELEENYECKQLCLSGRAGGWRGGWKPTRLWDLWL